MRRQLVVALGILLVAGAHSRAQDVVVVEDGAPVPVRPVPVTHGYTMPYQRGCSLKHICRWLTYRPLPSPAVFQCQKCQIPPQPPLYLYFIGEFGPRSPDLAYAGAVPGHDVGLPPPLYLTLEPGAASVPPQWTKVVREPVRVTPSWVKFSLPLPSFRPPMKTNNTIIIQETPAQTTPSAPVQALVRGMREETSPTVPVRDLPMMPTAAFPMPQGPAAAAKFPANTVVAPTGGVATESIPAASPAPGREMPVHPAPSSQEIQVHQTSPSILTPPSLLSN